MPNDLAIPDETRFDLTSRVPVRRETVYTLAEMVQIAELLAQSGFYKDVKEASQAFAKILRGAELGIGPAASLSEIDVIQGKPVLSAALCARLIKQSGKYNYRVITSTREECELEFIEFGQVAGRTKFTLDDAKAAGLTTKQGSNYPAYAEDMLFWRAMSRGAKRFCADVFGGAVYLEGESPPERTLPPHVQEVPVPTAALPPAPPQQLSDQATRWKELSRRARECGVDIAACRPRPAMSVDEIEWLLRVAEGIVTEAAEGAQKQEPAA